MRRNRIRVPTQNLIGGQGAPDKLIFQGKALMRMAKSANRMVAQITN